MTGTNMCAMSIDCEGKEADRGLLCADHRAEDAAIHARAFSDDECRCPSCRSDLAGLVPCERNNS